MEQHKNLIKTLSTGVLVCTVLLIARISYTGNFTYIFLVWNLFLAWVPLFISLMMIKIHPHMDQKTFKWLLIPLLACWLLFFPNAPYLVTDLVHVRNKTGPNFWYDLFLIFWFASAGISAGILSLYWVHQVTKATFGKFAGWLFVLMSTFLAGFGVYLGRMLRWNSWDIVTNPFALIKDCILQLNDLTALIMTFVFGSLLICIYFMFLGLLNYKVSSTRISKDHEK